MSIHDLSQLIDYCASTFPPSRELLEHKLAQDPDSWRQKRAQRIPTWLLHGIPYPDWVDLVAWAEHKTAIRSRPSFRVKSR